MLFWKDVRQRPYVVHIEFLVELGGVNSVPAVNAVSVSRQINLPE
jgi:hypothetical protein